MSHTPLEKHYADGSGNSRNGQIRLVVRKTRTKTGFDKKEKPGKFKESPRATESKIPELEERLYLENSTAC
jgi:hypothetical protein